MLPADALIQLTSIKCSTSATMLCHPLQCHHFYHRSRKLGSLVPGKKVVWLGFPERVSLFCFSACLFLKLHNYYLSSRCPLQFVLAILLFFFIVNSLTFFTTSAIVCCTVCIRFQTYCQGPTVLTGRPARNVVFSLPLPSLSLFVYVRGGRALLGVSPCFAPAANHLPS